MALRSLSFLSMKRPMFSSVVAGLHISDGDSSGRLDNRNNTRLDTSKPLTIVVYHFLFIICATESLFPGTQEVLKPQCGLLLMQQRNKPWQIHTHTRKLLVGGLSHISSALWMACGLLRSSEQERSMESEYESVSSTKMEMGTERLRW